MPQTSMQRISASQLDGRARTTRFKQQQLTKLYTAVDNGREKLVSMILEHTKHSRLEANIQVTLSLRAVRHNFESIDFHKSLRDEYSIAHGTDRPSRARPTGVVYIKPHERTLVYSVVDPLSAAIAAGNCIILELHQHPNILHPLKELLHSALDADTFVVVSSQPDDLGLLEDSIITLDAASQALATFHTRHVVAVVDRIGDLKTAAREIHRARSSFGGASPFCPTFLLVNDFALKELCSELEACIAGSLNSSNATICLNRLEMMSRINGSGDENQLLIHPISSLDDGIDFLGDLKCLSAAYLFTKPEAAKYLSQFIKARLTTVNHIPVELILGPSPPISIQSRIFPRFAPEDFSQIHPEFVAVSKQSQDLAQIIDAAGRGDPEMQTRATKRLLCEGKLQSSREPPGGGIGFFEKGIITGGSILLSSVFAVVLATKWYVVPLVWA